jgi:hypothetical protein
MNYMETGLDASVRSDMTALAESGASSQSIDRKSITFPSGSRIVTVQCKKSTLKFEKAD